MDEAGLAAALTAAAGQGFDLSNEIPLRAHLFELDDSDDEHVLLIVLHHIAGDGWSLGPLARDLAALYRARCSTGRRLTTRDCHRCRCNMPTTRCGSRRRWAMRTTAEARWRGSCRSGPRRLRTCRIRSSCRPTGRGPRCRAIAAAMCRSASTPELHRGLAGLARETGASLFMVLQAGLAGLLSRLGAGTDIAIGSPIAGRTDAALDDLIGFFVNTLVLRTDTSGQPSFRELIGRVRGRNLAAYGHQELPFERLVEVLNPARSLSRHPLFQVMLAFEAGEAGDGTLELPGLAVTPQPIATASAKFDLSVGLVEQRARRRRAGRHRRRAGIRQRPVRRSDGRDAGPAPDPAAGGRGRGRRTAAGPPADPGARPSATPSCAPGTTPRRSRFRPRPCRRCLPRRRRARRMRLRWCSRTARSRYAALDAHANRLAHHLQSLGVGPETMVGLCVERSPEMVVGLLGILKAGGAYLPLDPNYPRERLAFMLADAGCPVLVTQAALLDRLPDDAAHRRSSCGSTPTRRRSRAGPAPRRRSTSIRAIRPTSSTPRAPPAHQRASSSSMRASPIICIALGRSLGMQQAIALLQFASPLSIAAIEQERCRRPRRRHRRDHARRESRRSDSGSSSFSRR